MDVSAQWLLVLQLFAIGYFLVRICEYLKQIRDELGRQGDVQHYGRPQ
jgi:hypothetical protein